MYDLSRFGDLHVAVFGDLIADCWLIGHADRLCREAPVATVDVSERRINPGGAANAAANLAALGAHVQLLGTVGDDAAGDDLIHALKGYGVDTTAVHRRGVTHTKNRVVVDEKIVARFDQRRKEPEQIPNFAQDRPLLVADYDIGSWRESVIESLTGNRPEYLAIDSHHPELWKSTSPDLVTPNWYEAQPLMPSWDEQCHRSQHLRRHREEILANAGATRVLVTLDRDGAVLLTPNNGWFVETTPAPERNTIGAGDTTTAALLLALLTGVPDEKALIFANAAARIATAQPGTTVVSRSDFDVIDLRSAHGSSDPNHQSQSRAFSNAGSASGTELPL